MKKIVAFVLIIAALVILPSFAFAGFNNTRGIVLQTRLEVSKDGTNWDNYVAETDPGNQTLTVSPGDTIFFRLKTWNTSEARGANILYTASYTNPQYIDRLDPFHAGVGDDIDGDGSLYTITDTDPVAGTMHFSLDGVNGGTNETSGFESGGIAARISADAPDKAVILATVQITAASGSFNDYNYFSGRAYADDSATTQVRILISNPSVTPSVTPPYPISIGK